MFQSGLQNYVYGRCRRLSLAGLITGVCVASAQLVGNIPEVGFCVLAGISRSDEFVSMGFKMCTSKDLIKHTATLAVYAMLTDVLLLRFFSLTGGKEIIVS